MKSYIFIYSDPVGNREELKQTFNEMKSVVRWRYDVPHSFYILSNSSAGELAKEFEERRGTKGRFLFVEMTSNRQGRMLKDAWEFFKG